MAAGSADGKTVAKESSKRAHGPAPAREVDAAARLALVFCDAASRGADETLGLLSYRKVKVSDMLSRRATLDSRHRHTDGNTPTQIHRIIDPRRSLAVYTVISLPLVDIYVLVSNHIR